RNFRFGPAAFVAGPKYLTDIINAGVNYILIRIQISNSVSFDINHAILYMVERLHNPRIQHTFGKYLLNNPTWQIREKRLQFAGGTRNSYLCSMQVIQVMLYRIIITLD